MTSEFRRVLVAPTAFKGNMGPAEVAAAIATGVRAVWPQAEVLERPLSDGGTGLLEAYRAIAESEPEERAVTGPLGTPVTGRILWDGRTAVIESADACGLHLIPRTRREPLVTTTRGVGELLQAAADAERVYLGLGGSGTVDGGTGMARALGWRFVDGSGTPLEDGGGALTGLERIVAPERAFPVPVTALCDVNNPLTGERGAARVFGPQKGAGAADVRRLEAGLARLAETIRTDLGVDVATLPGAGAAGGAGAGARAFLGARLEGGAEWMMERAEIQRVLPDCDLVVTGEGRFDAQSGMGKLPGRVLEAARAAGRPALVACGRLEGEVPPGVWLAAGTGARLDRSSLARAVESACRAIERERRLG